MGYLDDFLASSSDENDESTAAEDDSTYGGDDHGNNKKKQKESKAGPQKKNKKRLAPPENMEVICIEDTPPPHKRRKSRHSVESATVKTLDSMSSPVWPSQGTEGSSFSQSHSVLATQEAFSPLPGTNSNHKPPRVSNDVAQKMAPHVSEVMEVMDTTRTTTSSNSTKNEFSTIEEAKLALQKRKASTDPTNNDARDSLANLEEHVEAPIFRLTKTNGKILSEASKKTKTVSKSTASPKTKTSSDNKATSEETSSCSIPQPERKKKQKVQSQSPTLDSQETVKPKKTKKSKVKMDHANTTIAKQHENDKVVPPHHDTNKSTKTSKSKKSSKPDTKDTVVVTGKENSEPAPQKQTKGKTYKSSTAAKKTKASVASSKKAQSSANEQAAESTKSTIQQPTPAEASIEESSEKPASTSANLTKQSSPMKQPEKAPVKKKKKKKLKFDEMILNHMLIVQHKPFTLKTLAQELDSTENALNYSMLSLLDKGVVTKKEFTSKSGRSKVLYWAVWGAKAKEVSVCMATPEELQGTKAELTELERQHLAIKNALKMLHSEMPNEEVDQKLQSEEAATASLMQEIAKVKARIAQGAKGPKPKLSRGPPKTAAQLARERCPQRLKMRFNHMRTEWVKRKQKCMDVVELLADGMEKKPKDVAKLLDLETDEMENAKLPPKKELDPDKK